MARQRATLATVPAIRPRVAPQPARAASEVVRPAIMLAGKELDPEALRIMIQAGTIRAADVAIDMVVDFQSKRKSEAFTTDRRLSISNAISSLTVTGGVETALQRIAGEQSDQHPSQDPPNNRAR